MDNLMKAKMKKIFNLLSLLLALQFATFAQQPANRSTATKIADLLAQQPANQSAKYLSAMKEMEQFTSADFTALLLTLKPQGKDNSAVEFATNSYALYVMQQTAKPELRTRYVQGLLAALNQLSNRENKAYIFELLKFCGKDETISAVAPYLSDDYFAEKAARVLSAIHSVSANQTLTSALAKVGSEKTATAIIAALGEIGSSQSEDAIIASANQFNSANYKSTVLSALSKLGTAKSLRIFSDASRAVNYQFEQTNALGLAINYAYHLITINDKLSANTLANQIYQEANEQNAISAKVDALRVLTQIDPAKQHQTLLSLAVSDRNNTLQTTALSLLKDNTKTNEVLSIAGKIKSLNPLAQENILHFLAAKNVSASLPIVNKVFTSLKSSEAKIAALKALSVLSQENNTSSLIKYLATADEKEQNAIKTILLSSKNPQTFTILNNSLATASKTVQLNLLDILALRCNTESAKSVFSLLAKTKDNEVKLAAYKALPNVVSDKDFTEAFSALDRANDDELKFAQNAVSAAFLSSPERQARVSKMAASISRSNAPSAARLFPIFASEGSPQSLQAVQNYLNQPGELRNAAIAALASWSNPSALTALTSLLRNEKDDKNFNTVFAGFIKQLNASSANNSQKTLLLREAFELAKTTAQKTAALTSLKATGTYQALAFAANYLNDADLKKTATDVVMNIAMDNKSYLGTDVRNWLEKAKNNLSGSESSYLKEAIVRHLAEMPRAEGFVSIFNGKDLTGWKGLVENPIKRAKMTSDELNQQQALADEKMRASWSVENGTLLFNGKGDNLATTKLYGDFEMLVDWKLDKNGKEPDAGIYLRGTPQVQIWDISRTNVGAQVGSGGLYNNTKNPSKPLKVADNPLGDWNTFKIRMVDDKVSVWLNGELVVDQVTLENYWDRNQAIFPTEQIELQAHGSKVWYRDIYVKELPRKQIFALSEQEKKEGFEMLFDGTSLNKWTSSPAYEINDEGFITANPAAKFGKNIYTKDEYADFVYRFEFKLTPGANNGVGIRAPLEGDAAYLGYEIQVLDDDADIYKELAPYQYHGSVYGIIPAKRGAQKPLGEWNEEEIRIKGNKIKVTLNGQVIVDGDIKKATRKGTADKKEHPGLQKTSGHIGFLGHGSEVFFRNIRIKKL
jgi:hypothetical protein